MCILLNLDCAKFGVSDIFFSKVIEENPFRGRLDPHRLGKEKVKHYLIMLKIKSLIIVSQQLSCRGNFVMKTFKWYGPYLLVQTF